MEALNSLQDDLNSMEQRLTEMEDKMDSIDGKLTQVVDAILGNPLTKQGGFMAEIAQLKEYTSYLNLKMEGLEARQRKHDQFKNKIIWTIGIIISLAAITKFIVDIYISLKK